MRKFLALSLSATLFLAGCAARVKNVTNLPPGVTLAEVQSWDKEVAALHKIASGTSAVRQGILGLEQAGAFGNSQEYVKALVAVAKIDQLELVASAYLKQNPQHFGQAEKSKITGMLQEIGGQITALESVAAIKNADTKNQISTLVAELVATMNLALSFAQ
jgi:hypothetical protein